MTVCACKQSRTSLVTVSAILGGFGQTDCADTGGGGMAIVCLCKHTSVSIHVSSSDLATRTDGEGGRKVSLRIDV